MSGFDIGKEIGLLYGELSLVKDTIKRNNNYIKAELSKINSRLNKLEEANKIADDKRSDSH